MIFFKGLYIAQNLSEKYSEEAVTAQPYVSVKD